MWILLTMLMIYSTVKKKKTKALHSTYLHLLTELYTSQLHYI